ncbi:MAG TPA: type II toxin-antitoxin system prevent-host-death family antitoxin [Steroidobacteraceae bacterium]|nr:type II toxin-antitoxin system prevent-host-death family antitoxin [Steroidobacteraceae bacterium]
MVNVHAAKTQLSRLLEQVEAGAEIIIARAGKPVARLLPLEQLQPKRQPGRLKGKIPPPPDSFFDPLTDEELAKWGLL